MGLATIWVFGEYLDCQDLIFPGSAGTPARLTKAGFVLLRVRSPKGAIRPT